MPPTPPLRHLRIEDRAKAEKYTNPVFPRGPFKTPVRDRVPHGEGLLGQLDQAEAEAQQQQEEEKQRGTVLEFRSHPDFKLFLKSLESSQQKIELLNVQEDGPVSIARVLVLNQANPARFGEENPAKNSKSSGRFEGIRDCTTPW